MDNSVSVINGVRIVRNPNGLTFESGPTGQNKLNWDADGNLTLQNGPSNPNIFGVHALRGTFLGLHLQGDGVSNSDLFVSPSGKIGINNMTSPTHQLHVNGSFRVTEDVNFGGTHAFHVNAASVAGGRFRVEVDGNVGIGSTTSLGRLGVNFVGFNAAMNVRSRASDDFILHAEGATGVTVLAVENDAEVRVFGNFFVANGSKNFITDHPLDPANRSLQHACVESNEVLNVYSGTAVLGATGVAEVVLPDYFEALNRDFRYQLTCMGGFAPVFISKKVGQNRFEIGGGTAGLEVSWQVTGVRNDAWQRDHPYQDVVEKKGGEKGRYFYPEGFAQPAELGLCRNLAVEK